MLEDRVMPCGECGPDFPGAFLSVTLADMLHVGAETGVERCDECRNYEDDFAAAMGVAQVIRSTGRTVEVRYHPARCVGTYRRNPSVLGGKCDLCGDEGGFPGEMCGRDLAAEWEEAAEEGEEVTDAVEAVFTGAYQVDGIHGTRVEVECIRETDPWVIVLGDA